MMDVVVKNVRGEVKWVCIKDRNKVIAYMLVVFSRTEQGITAAIQQIHTTGQNRRKGLATTLIGSLINSFGKQIEYIYTSWDNSTKEGRKLMLSCGFKVNGDKFEWKRPKNNIVIPKIIIPGDVK